MKKLFTSIPLLITVLHLYASPCNLNIAVTKTDPICNGSSVGSIVLKITNGTSPYAYKWSDGSTYQNKYGLGGGVYSVTVSDAANCSASATVTITEPPMPVVYTTPSKGNDGTAKVNVSGISYTWSRGGQTTQTVTGLAPGLISVTVTDIHTCVYHPAAIVQPFGSENYVLCFNYGDSIDIDNNGSKDVYIFSMFGIDSGDIQAQSLNSEFKVSDQTAFQNSIFNSFRSGCELAQTTMICDWNAEWYPNTGDRYLGVEKVSSISDTTFGWLRLEFKGGLHSCSDTMFIHEKYLCPVPNRHVQAGEKVTVTSIDLAAEKGLSIYPNPFSEIAAVSYNLPPSTQKAFFNIFDLSGRLMKSFLLDPHTTSTSISSLGLFNGVYFYDLVADGVSVAKNKLVILK